MIERLLGPGSVGGLMVRAAGIAYALGFAMACSTDPDETTGDDLKYGAFDVCTQFVKERLTSPGSAEFPNEFEDDGEVVFTNDTADTDVWTITSQVDSENGFGALLRSHFTCKVRHVEGTRWKLVDLDITEG